MADTGERKLALEDLVAKGVKCPHCGGEISAQLWATAVNEHRLSIRVEPNPGELISASTFAGLVRSTSRLLEAVGRDMGTKTQVLLERIETDGNGAHKAHFVVARTRLALKDAPDNG